jgi:lipopolysaccharide/colanic/teichoic acid biosynthesis glycosyltransferase
MNPRAIRHIIFAGDLVWIICSAVVAYMLGTGSSLSLRHLQVAFHDSMFLMTCAGIAWVFVFHRMKLDGFYGGYEVSAVLSQLFTGTITLLVLIASAGFLLREETSRTVLFTFTGILFVLAFGGRLMARAFAQRLSAAGKRHRVVVMGNGRIARELAERIQKHPEMRWEVVGFLFPTGDDFVEPLLHAGHSSKLNSLQIETLLQNNGVDELILTSGLPDQREVVNLIANCRHRGVRVSLVPNLYELYVNRPSLVDLDGVPLLRINDGEATTLQMVLKRTVDLVLGSALLALGSPILLATMATLWIHKGNAFASEMRCGCNGRPFRMYRFNVDRAAANLSGTEKTLALLSVTELPQLLNVLKGDMSLVGPRPEPYDRVKRYSDWQRQRLSCKPGVTGLAQVHGLREENSSEAKAYYDLRYIQDWSLLADLSLVLQTIWTISRRFIAEAPETLQLGDPAVQNPTEFVELAHADRS